jgi:DNA-binding beta-propeller fold protein YncE
VAPAGQDVVDSDADELTEQVSGESLTSPVSLAADATEGGGQLQRSTMSVVDEPATAQTQALMGIPATFIGVASAFVTVLLSPLLAPSPVAPAEPPLAWALLAFARREWHHMFLNRTPHGVVDTVTTSEGTDVTIDVISGADPDAPAGDVVTVTEVSQPENGTVSIDGGTLIYTPDPDFNGTDTFSYTLSDEDSPLHIHGLRGLWGAVFGGDALHTNTVTVTVTVTPVNDAPVAVDDAATVGEDSGPTVIDVLGNDTDGEGDDLSVTGVDAAGNGTLTLTDGVITYTPDDDFHGTDSFTYTISDGQGGTATATVHVTVTSVGDAPEAGDDSYTTEEDTPLHIPAPGVLGNDVDADGDDLTVIILDNPTNGAVVLDGNGSFFYNPDADFHGDDSFTYMVIDGSGETATATVHLTVTPVNDAPVAVDDSYITDEDTVLDIAAPGVLGNDVDADGDDLRVTIVDNPVNGLLVVQDDGSFTYTPKAGFTGTDSFTYTVFDDTGASARATVTLTVEAKVRVITFDDGATPSEVFTTDDPTRILVRTGSQLRVVDTATGDWLDTIELGARPQSMTMSPDGRYVYVGSFSFSTDLMPIARIDVETGTVTSIGGVRQPAAMAISDDGGTLYVTNYQDGTVSKIDTATGDYTLIGTGLQSSAIAVGEDGTTLYVGSIINDVRVVNLASGTFTVLKTGTYDEEDGVLSVPSITVVGNHAYVTDEIGDKLVVIDTDTDTIIDTYDVGDRPTAVAAMPGDPMIFVANSTGKSVSVINTEFGGVIGEIELAGNPVDIDVVDGFLYVTTTAGVVVIAAEKIGGLIDGPALDA